MITEMYKKFILRRFESMIFFKLIKCENDLDNFIKRSAYDWIRIRKLKLNSDQLSTWSEIFYYILLDSKHKNLIKNLLHN